ncbi:5-histidylcysteine sulfoxide synthase [uncultured Paraglaciecola sp.]|uniref:5-histidylcysteine sulfoxide synthase n=1 Tax=uncultured Paraglaciecola sp. TaxID=1765024 RepID=UPI0025F9596E|nr:5-histidylcysteine sulfoxide synthase [uncultured Paraglaciecola sp.]
MLKQKLITLDKPPLLIGNDIEQKRAELRAYFEQTWELYESLFSLINQDEAFLLRPEPLRHPLIFYFGHTAVFYVNKLLLGQFIQTRVNSQIESVCAVGVDEMSWDDLSADNYQWPSVEAVSEYRDQVKDRILSLIDNMQLSLPITQDSLAWVILMGCEHERIHIETSSVIIRMLDSDYLTSSSAWKNCEEVGQAPNNILLSVAGKSLVLGKPDSNQTYGWDNEYGQLPIAVRDFSASQYLVSNQEFMQFVEAGGYQKPHYWTEEGQSWLAFTKSEMPRFWRRKNAQYWQRNLTEEVLLPLSWPVEVNYLEAKAFCNWKDENSQDYVRLPTEAEWQVLRDQLHTDLADWNKAPGNINLEHFASSCPVDTFKQTEFYDVIGNVWQWTESLIDGYEGFKVHPLYDDFSTPTFDGQHNLIKGGSWISTGNEATRDSRYAFRRHFYQHAGFRYVSSKVAEVPISAVTQCEMQTDISRLLHHHYGKASYQADHDLQQILGLLQPYLTPESKVLDLGCGTGRLAFDLAQTVGHVDGIDFTARHIQHCLNLKDQGQLRYAMPTQGDIFDFHEVTLNTLGFEKSPENLCFAQGDGHNLKPQFSGYDLAICHRVIEYSYHPSVLLEQLSQRLKKGGVLVLGSSYAWDLSITDKQHWIGGFKRNGENLCSQAHLTEIMLSEFDLLQETQVLSQFELDQRTSQTANNHITIWRKRV